jgi:hypothetical protein
MRWNEKKGKGRNDGMGKDEDESVCLDATPGDDEEIGTGQGERRKKVDPIATGIASSHACSSLRLWNGTAPSSLHPPHHCHLRPLLRGTTKRR